MGFEKVKTSWRTVDTGDKNDGLSGVGYDLNKNAMPKPHRCFVERCQAGWLIRELREGGGQIPG